MRTNVEVDFDNLVIKTYQEHMDKVFNHTELVFERLLNLFLSFLVMKYESDKYYLYKDFDEMKEEFIEYANKINGDKS